MAGVVLGHLASWHDRGPGDDMMMVLEVAAEAPPPPQTGLDRFGR